MNKYVSSIATVLLLALIYIVSQRVTSGEEYENVEEMEFVTIENGNFAIGDTPFRFAGTNAYYLPNYVKLDSIFVESTFAAFADAGISVIRMWAFYDGFDCGYSSVDIEENVIQTSAGVYSERALRDLDFVIARGKQRNMKFILPFINYWDELGGICQYNTWAGATDPSTNMEFFLSNPDTQKWFKEYVYMLLNRVNVYTGVAYKDEPAIHSWQIMIEGRYPGENPEILRDWYREMAIYIKSIDTNHLVGTGEEGFDEGEPSAYSLDEYSNLYPLRANEGSSYLLNTEIPEIDYGNAHWYPSEYGYGHRVTPEMLRAQRAWLTDHARIAKQLEKPFVLGEYGFPGWGDERVVIMYDSLWSVAEEIELDGSLLWQFTTDYIKCVEFGGNICWPGGRKDSVLYHNFKHHIGGLQH
ncbi:MAG: cellulase family glycosylhydrolase [Balneolales bacterium]|nr:cellulase family glycosylhydrolase [Balneolales bacterium]